MPHSFLVPIGLVNLTTTQRNAITTPAIGATIYNTTTGAQETWDGTAWGQGVTVATQINAGMFAYINGAVPINSKVVMQIADVAISFPVGIPGSVVYADTAPTADCDFTIHQEAASAFGTVIDLGTISFTANNNNASFTFTATASIGKGDLIYVKSPADTYGAQDVFFNILGTSFIPVYG